MRFLLDQNQSPHLTSLLADEGHDAVHVRDLGLHAATDDEILTSARDDDRIIVSADTDLGALLARHNTAGPSVILSQTASRRWPGRKPRESQPEGGIRFTSQPDQRLPDDTNLSPHQPGTHIQVGASVQCRSLVPS